MLPLIPQRRYGREILEDPTIDDALVVRSIRDLVVSNKLFHGAGALISELEPFFGRLGPEGTLLDVGTGLGDIPRRAARVAANHAVRLHTIGLDTEYVLLRHARVAYSGPPREVCASALALPFPDRSVDLVTCSQVLHHFRGHDATTLLREMNRVARVAVVISDIRRSWLAASGFWVASFPLFFHPVTRHDGVLSVMRGFTPDELVETVRQAIGIAPVVRRRLGWRLTTSWTPRLA